MRPYRTALFGRGRADADILSHLEAAVAGMRAAMSGDVLVQPFPLPATLRDSFAAAGWNRPETYLDERVRGAMSPFATAPATVVDAAVERLRRDLASGVWDKNYQHMRERAAYDAGYYVPIARGSLRREA